MRTPDDRANAVEDAAIDRLVDGSLTDLERRDLLLRLEAEPDGWRRCALAFLEDQTWRMALSEPVAPALAVRSKPSERIPARRASRFAGLRRLAVAAVLLASTFAAGFASRGTTPFKTPIEVVQKAPDDASPRPKEEASVSLVGWYDVTDGSTGEAPSGRLPMLTGPGLNEQWLRDQPPSVPDYVRSRLERQGYQVEERRKLVSVELADGRRVSIPVEEVELDYVGQKPL